MFSSHIIRLTTAAVTLAAAATLTATAPTQAAPRPGPGNLYTTVAVSGTGGGAPVSGCSVTITATVRGNSSLGLGSNFPPILFWDNGMLIGQVTPTRQNATPRYGPALVANIRWQPATPGYHHLRARYVGGNYTPPSEGQTTVMVRQGMNAGSAGCLM